MYDIFVFPKRQENVMLHTANVWLGSQRLPYF